MFHVYLLKSSKDDGFYIGCTEDLERRMREHQEGMVDSTKDRRPHVLVYYEAYLEKESAQLRERNLKEFGSAYSGLLKRLGYK